MIVQLKGKSLSSTIFRVCNKIMRLLAISRDCLINIDKMRFLKSVPTSPVCCIFFALTLPPHVGTSTFFCLRTHFS